MFDTLTATISDLNRRWLLLIHQLPAKPAYIRVKIWRRLQRIGAVAIKNSVYVLPKSDQTLEDFQWIVREIVEGGGDASLCEAGFVEAARLAGNGTMRVLAVHIYPNCLPPMMVQASLNLGWAMLNAAGLAFIGLGVRPPTPEWGILVAEGASFILSGEWWIALFPGLALMLAVFCFNLMGDGLRDLIDPRRRT